MTCPRFRELLKLQEKELSQEDRVDMQQHALSCCDCQREVREQGEEDWHPLLLAVRIYKETP